MRNKRFRLSVLILTVLAVALLTCACNKSDGGEGGNAASDTGTSSEADNSSESSADSDNAANTGNDGEKEKMITLSSGKKAVYTVVCDEENADVRVKVDEFVNSLSVKTGAKFSKTSSSAFEEYEIIIGRVDRAASKALYRGISYSDYSVSISDSKIYFSYYELPALTKMLNAFLEAVTDNGDGSFTVNAALNISGSLSSVGKNVPRIDDDDRYLSSVISAGESNRMVTFEGCADSVYAEYTAKLQAEGYSEYADSNISGNLFSTYIKDKTQITLYWYPTKHTMKLIYGPKSALPSTERSNVASLCTPSITQLARAAVDESYPNGAPGMGYVIQLSDGRYIIVDGGPVDKDSSDVKALYDYLVANKPASHAKPQVAMWIITHAHIDHTGLATAFLATYGGSVEIERFAYNFPDFSAIVCSEGNTPLMNNAENLKFAIHTYAKNAQTLVLHTGYQFWVGDAFIEILYTPENHAPATFPTGNHTSIALRVRIKNKSVMLLGDCEKSLCEYMAEVYGSYLKSDMLQVTHHGVNGGSLALYKLIDPDVCFWAIDEKRFNEHSQIRGNKAWDYNKWILDSSVKARTHYHNSKTAKVNF